MWIDSPIAHHLLDLGERDRDHGDIDFYNVRRPHQNLDYRTPDEMYFGMQTLKETA